MQFKTIKFSFIKNKFIKGSQLVKITDDVIIELTIDKNLSVSDITLVKTKGPLIIEKSRVDSLYYRVIGRNYNTLEDLLIPVRDELERQKIITV